MTKRKPKSQHKKSGKPTVMTPDVLAKLHDSFVNGFTDRMACLYAGISPDALYDYCKKNPKYAEQKELLKDSPDLKAQKTLVEDLGNTQGARWWAERRMKHFMPKTGIELSGQLDVNDVTNDEKMKEIAKEYEEKMRDAIVASMKK